MQQAEFSYNLREGFYVHIKTVGTNGEFYECVGGLRIYSWDDMSEFIKTFKLGNGYDSNMPMQVHAERYLFLSGLEEKDPNNPFYSINLKDTLCEKQKQLHVIDFWVVNERIPTFGELKKSSVFCANKHGCEKCKHEKCLFSMDSRLDKKLAVVDYNIPGKIRLLNQDNIVIKKSTGAQLYKDTQPVPTKLVDFFNSKIIFNLNQPWITIER